MNIFFFGDSICFGQGISIHKGWVPRISSDIEKLSLGKKIPILVINSAANGDTTRKALERMPYDIQSHGLDAILIQFGMNDCNYWRSDKGLPRVSRHAFEANLYEIIDRAKNFGATLIMLNTNHPTPKYQKFNYTSVSYQESNEAYNKIIRKVAKDSRSILIDIEKEFKQVVEKKIFKLTDLLLADKLHLSLAGHDLYYKIIYPVMIRKIKNLIIDH